jgi:hypothetical protein
MQLYLLYKVSCKTFSGNGRVARGGAVPPHSRGFTITLRHTTLSRTSLDE